MDYPIKTIPRSEVSPSLEKIISDIIGGSAPQEKHYIIHMLGIPGSGKSSLAEEIYKSLKRPSHTIVGFDSLMKAIPEYNVISDRERAFAEFEMPARTAGYVLIKELLDKKADILFDNGGNLPQHVELLEYANSIGYTIVVVKVVTRVEDAKARIASRLFTEGRHTPLSYVDERNAIIEKVTPEYRITADFIFEISNQGTVSDWKKNLQDSAKHICEVAGL